MTYTITRTFTEHPILFSTPMVQAVLAGRKTQTRRIVKQAEIQKSPDLFKYNGNSREIEIPRPAVRKYDDRVYHSFERVHNNSNQYVLTSPYGGEADRLWVRETFAQLISDFPADKYFYKADGDYHAHKWKPSIFMPRAAARIILEIINVRVERMQNISSEDAMAEGILFYDDKVLGRRFKDYWQDASGYGDPEVDYPTLSTAVESFYSLWTKINGQKSFIANPFVWVIEFNRIS